MDFAARNDIVLDLVFGQLFEVGENRSMQETAAMVMIGALLFAIGHSAGRSVGEPTERWLLAVGAVIIVAALVDGDYWSVFPRGRGFFTANRLSAGIAFAAALLVAYFDQRRRILAARRTKTGDATSANLVAMRAFIRRQGNVLAVLGMIGVVLALIVLGQMRREQRRERCYALLEQEQRFRGDVIPFDDHGQVYGYGLAAMPENTCADGQMPPEYRYLQNQLDP
ncbi:MAG: hypothetical protein K2Y20_09065 [Sphingomonas sp.]|nr:hypothetical protein [Sphingomonas sp.]